MTFPELLTALRQCADDAPLVFETSGARISGGYHVTELRNAEVTGIDCGGQISRFQEARLQLLDGGGGAHMRVGTFRGIVEKSLTRLPELAEAPFLVEYGPGNRDLSLLRPGAPIAHDTEVVLPLQATTAECKPFERRRSAMPSATPACC